MDQPSTLNDVWKWYIYSNSYSNQVYSEARCYVEEIRSEVYLTVHNNHRISECGINHYKCTRDTVPVIKVEDLINEIAYQNMVKGCHIMPVLMRELRSLGVIHD